MVVLCLKTVSLPTVLEDYDSITSVFTFQPLVTRSCITINIIDDNIVENTEQFSVSLSSPSSTVTVIIGQPRQATVVIRDNDEEVPSPSPPGKNKSVHYALLQ